VKVSSDHLGERSVVGHDGLEVNVNTEFVGLRVKRSVKVLAVAWVESIFDLLTMSERQLEILREFLQAWVGGVGDGAHVAVNEGGNLATVFREHSSGNLVQNWSLREGLEDLVYGGNSEFSWFVAGHEDGHEDLLNLSWHDFSDLSESQNSLNSDLSAVGFNVLDDFLKFENTDIETHVSNCLEEEDLVLELLSTSEFLEQLLRKLFLESTRAEFVCSNLEFQSPLVFIRHAKSVDHGANSQVDGLFQEPVSLANFVFSQSQHLVDHFLADGADVDEALDNKGGTDGVDLSLTDFLNQVEDGVLSTSIGQSVDEERLDFLVFFGGEALRVGLEVGLVDSFQFGSGQHAEDLDQSDVLVGSFLLDGFAHFGDEASQNGGHEGELVFHVRVGGVLEECLLTLHEELFFSDIPVRGVDHVGVRWLGVSGLLSSRLDWSRGDQDQGLVDVGGNDVFLSVEGNQGVLALNNGGFNEEFVSGSSDVVLGDGAASQEFLIIGVFLVTAWARIREAEVVLDLGSLLALLEVDGLGDVEDWAAGVAGRSIAIVQALGLAGHGVQGLALSFKGILHDGVEVIFGGLALLDLVGDLSFLSQIGGSMAVKVDLEHVEDTSLDVGRPGFLTTIENDVADHSLAVGELDGDHQFLLQLRLDRGLLECHEGDHSARIGDLSVKTADSDSIDGQNGGLFSLEDQGNQSLDPGSGMLLAGARNTRS